MSHLRGTIPDQLLEWYEDWTMELECSKCFVRYREIDSVGRHQCMVHLGRYPGNDQSSKEWPANHWSCCGASRDKLDAHFEDTLPLGCYPMDHTTAQVRYSSRPDRDNLLDIVPDAFVGLSGVPLADDAIVAHVRIPDQEARSYPYTDDSFVRRKVVPIQIPNHDRLQAESEFISDFQDRRDNGESGLGDFGLSNLTSESVRTPDDLVSFYADAVQFVHYYVVRRVSTSQDADKADYFLRIPELHETARRTPRHPASTPFPPGPRGTIAPWVPPFQEPGRPKPIRFMLPGYPYA